MTNEIEFKKIKRTLNKIDKMPGRRFINEDKYTRVLFYVKNGQIIKLTEDTYMTYSTKQTVIEDLEDVQLVEYLNFVA